MSLQSGTRLGPYEITAQIGVGGMGEVYRATDTKLDRQVAIKVLPDAVAQDAERLARFDREAKTLASLNHPGIAAIYGLEDSDGSKALVMELVEGPTLADRIAEGKIPVDEALPIAKQIAEALEAAHEQGIIHRDLKPANIKLRPDGTVKVLDFGLAKAMEPAAAASPSASMSPTITTPAMTQAGLILGSAAYMSPEQAKGRPADQRSDVWAFGAVLYEMLSGRRAFEAEDVSETLAAVLRAEVDLSALPENVPSTIALAIRRCLQKDPKQRIAHVQDVRLALEGAFDVAVPTPVSRGKEAASWQVAVVGVGMFALGAVAAGGMFQFLGQPGPEQRVRRMSVTLAAGQQYPESYDSTLAVSPDGATVIYKAIEDGVIRLYRLDLDRSESVAIPGTEGAGNLLAVSPDGESLAFVVNTTTLMRVPLNGGRPIRIGEVDLNPAGAAWGSDGALIVGQRSAGMVTIPTTGGEPVTLAVGEQARTWMFPQVLPGGEKAMFTEATVAAADGDLMLLDLATGDVELLIENATSGRYVSTGHVVFVRDQGVWAAAFDLDRLEVTGAPVLLEPGIGVDGEGGVALAVASDGTLFYFAGDADELTVLGFADRSGSVELLDMPANRYVAPRLSPDGSRVAVQSLNPDGSDIWIYELSGEAQIRQLTRSGNNIRPLWTPDGERIVFASEREGARGIFSQLADGTGEAERLTTATDGAQHFPDAWTPDGQTLTFTSVGLVGGALGGIRMWSASDGEDPEFFRASDVYAGAGDFSPDGQWLAYWAGDEGSNEVYVTPFPAEPGVEFRVTQNTGAMAHWSPDGSELFYRPSPADIASLRSVGISLEPSFQVTAERTLPIEGFVVTGNYRSFDITPDGERFLMVFPEGYDGDRLGADGISVVQNWTAELERLVPTN